MKQHQHFCGDSLNYLNEKTKLVESDISYRVFRISNGLLHHFITFFIWICPLVFSYKEIFKSNILLLFYLLNLGCFSFGIVSFLFLSLKYKLFLKSGALFYYVFGQITVSGALSLLPLLIKCEVLPNGEESCSGVTHIWIIVLSAIMFFYLPSASRISKGIITPLKKLRRTLGKEKMSSKDHDEEIDELARKECEVALEELVIKKYFAPTNLNYINQKTNIVRKAFPYCMFLVTSTIMWFSAVVVGVLPQVFTFKKLFDLNDANSYFGCYLFFIASFLIGAMLFAFLSLRYSVFNKKRTIIRFLSGALVFIGLFSYLSLFTQYVRISSDREELRTNIAMYILDILIVLFYCFPALFVRFYIGVTKPLKELRKIKPTNQKEDVQ